MTLYIYINAKFTQRPLFRQLWFSHISPSLRPKTFPPSPGNPSPLLQEAQKDKNDQSRSDTRYFKHLSIFTDKWASKEKWLPQCYIFFFFTIPSGKNFKCNNFNSVYFSLCFQGYYSRLNRLLSLGWRRDNVRHRYGFIMKGFPLGWDKQEGGSTVRAAKMIINALCCGKSLSMWLHISIIIINLK